MVKKLIAGLVLIGAVFIPTPASAHTGDVYHNYRIMYHGRLSENIHYYKVDDFIAGSAHDKFRARIADAFNETEDISSTQGPNFVWDGTSMGLSEAEEKEDYANPCANASANWEVFTITNSWTYGSDRVAVTKKSFCDGDGVYDKFVMLINRQDYTYGVDTTYDVTHDIDLQGLVTHEAMHATGFDSHWDDGFEDSPGINQGKCENNWDGNGGEDTMCTSVYGTFTINPLRTFHWRTLEHDDKAEYLEEYA